MRPAEDSTAASWIAKSLHGFAQDVGSIVPPVFGAYLRLFHPAWVGAEDVSPVTWSEIASANGRVAHPEMQFHSLVPKGHIERMGNVLERQPGLWESSPEVGSLDPDVVERLLPVLREHTQTPDRCWFAFWDGWGIPVLMTAHGGSEAQPRAPRNEHDRWNAPQFSIPGRDLLLFAGSIDDALESFYEPYVPGHLFPQSAYFWWPEDRAWCVATEIDFMSTYIGASEGCVEALLKTPGIETLPVSIADRITSDGDTINPNPFSE